MMRSKIMLLSVCLAALGETFAKGPVPADIRAFVKNADACEHLAGEWDSDLEPGRKREIERGVDKFCLQAQRQLQRVEVKYRDRPTLRDLIARHAYDSVRSYARQD
jgi:hypothetical protein